MKVHGNIWTEVDVDPIRAAESLLETVIKHQQYIEARKDGRYFLMSIGGYHRKDEKIEEVTKEDYEFVIHMRRVVDYLRKKS